MAIIYIMLTVLMFSAINIIPATPVVIIHVQRKNTILLLS